MDVLFFLYWTKNYILKGLSQTNPLLIHPLLGKKNFTYAVGFSEKTCFVAIFFTKTLLYIYIYIYVNTHTCFLN